MDVIDLLQVNIQILLQDGVLRLHVEDDVEADDEGLEGGGHHPHVVLVVVLGKQIVGLQSEQFVASHPDDLEFLLVGWLMVHPVEVGGGQGRQHGLGVFVSVGIFPVVADLGLPIQDEEQLLDEVPFSIDQLVIPVPPDRAVGQILLDLHQGDGLEDQGVPQQCRKLIDLPHPDLLEVSIEGLVLEPQQHRDLLGPDGVWIGFVSLQLVRYQNLPRLVAEHLDFFSFFVLLFLLAVGCHLALNQNIVEVMILALVDDPASLWHPEQLETGQEAVVVFLEHLGLHLLQEVHPPLLVKLIDMLAILLYVLEEHGQVLNGPEILPAHDALAVAVLGLDGTDPVDGVPPGEPAPASDDFLHADQLALWDVDIDRQPIHLPIIMLFYIEQYLTNYTQKQGDKGNGQGDKGNGLPLKHCPSAGLDLIPDPDHRMLYYNNKKIISPLTSPTHFPFCNSSRYRQNRRPIYQSEEFRCCWIRLSQDCLKSERDCVSSLSRFSKWFTRSRSLLFSSRRVVFYYQQKCYL